MPKAVIIRVMPLDKLARRYAENLFWKRVEELSQQHGEAVRQLKYKYAQSNLPLPGPFFSQYADLLVEHARLTGEARLNSLVKAYEQSGLPFNEVAMHEVKTETVHWCRQQQRNSIGVISPLVSQTYGNNSPQGLRDAIIGRLESGIAGLISRFGRDLEIMAYENSLSNSASEKSSESLATSIQESFMASANDRKFCELAVREARNSISEDDGRPRPKVGAVVVRNEEVLGAAHRGERPKNHAEYIALEIKLSETSLAGATVYTTLEPCTSRNPPKVPCAQRLVERKVARVFIGMLDPNPDIQGNGVKVLRQANIEVQFFPKDLMVELEELNREFTRQFDDKRPPTKISFPIDSDSSLEGRKIAEILKFKGQLVTVFSKQKYGHGFLEGTSDAVLIDCDFLGVVLKFAGSDDEMSFSLNQIELSRDMAKKRLKLTIFR
jgi:pyrimidine deaminase RibD-like protein